MTMRRKERKQCLRKEKGLCSSKTLRIKKEKETFARVARLKKRKQQEPTEKPQPKLGRNDPCNCGSGKKFKKCCLYKEETNV